MNNDHLGTESHSHDSQGIENDLRVYADRMLEVKFEDAVKEVELRKQNFELRHSEMRDDLEQLKTHLQAVRKDAESIHKKHDHLRTTHMPAIRKETDMIKVETEEIKELVIKEFEEFQHYFNNEDE